MLQLSLVAVLDPADHDALGRECRPQLPLPQPRLLLRELEDTVPDSRECLLRREAVGRANREARLRLAQQPRDPNLEELVEVRGEDRAELHALEQRERFVRGQLEHARVEVEERDLSIEKSLDVLVGYACGHPHIFYRLRGRCG